MNHAPHLPKKARRAAYILLEVMLATAIFAMAGVSLAVLLSNAISAGKSVQYQTRVVWDLESRLNEARLMHLGMELGTVTDKPDAQGIVFVREITALNLKNKQNQSLTNIFNIKITARWKEHNRDMDMEAQTYVYQQ